MATRSQPKLLAQGNRVRRTAAHGRGAWALCVSDEEFASAKAKLLSGL